jgi:hypothetical protein
VAEGERPAGLQGEERPDAPIACGRPPVVLHPGEELGRDIRRDVEGDVVDLAICAVVGQRRDLPDLDVGRARRRLAQQDPARSAGRLVLIGHGPGAQQAIPQVRGCR